MAKKIVVLFILSLLFAVGCGDTKTETPGARNTATAIENEPKDTPINVPQSQRKQEDLGYLPEPFTIKDRQEIEETIRKYFDALDRKDFGSASDLWANSTTTRQEFISTYDNMQVEYVKIKSIKGYTLSQQNGIKNVDQTVPTPYMAVEFDFKAKQPFPTTFFPSVKKDLAESWKIYGLGTSP